MTDENRDRARIWSSVLDNVGYTEQAGEKPLVDRPERPAAPAVPGREVGRPDDHRAARHQDDPGDVVRQHHHVHARRPRRAALDGDPTTAWRAAALGDAIGQYIRLQLDTPIVTDHVNLVQPINGGRNRWITKVQLIFDGHTKESVALDASSRSAPGQTITFPKRRFSNLEIKITGVSDPRRKLFAGADAVGFAEIRLRDEHSDQDVRVDEVEQMPQDLLDALGAASASHPLVIVMARDALRPVPPRTDPELSIARTFVLPTTRTFELTGGASVNPGASDAAIDAALGIPPAVTAEASESMPGCLACHAASAADGNPATAWNTPFVGSGRAVGAVRDAETDHVLEHEAPGRGRRSPLAADPDRAAGRQLGARRSRCRRSRTARARTRRRPCRSTSRR